MVKSSKKTADQSIKVKSVHEVAEMLQRQISFHLHSRHALRLSPATQRKIVGYGPWLAIVLVLAVLPELFMFAKTGQFMQLTGFFDTILFNRESWVVLSILLVNILLLVDGIGELFEKKKKGWQRVYLASLIGAGYIVWQLIANLSQPAAPLLSSISIAVILFTLLDVEEYYQ